MSAVDRHAIHRYTVLALLAWTLLVGGGLYWSYDQEETVILERARDEARTSIGKDLAFRRWATSHGGVYVPPDAETPPNPYLQVPERDVTTTSGRALTLMNPAYMVRQMQQRFGDPKGVRGHITSLKPINPNNAPDAWEAEAMRAFEAGGAKEVSTVAVLDGRPHMRVIRAMIVEKGCLKCHARQGYEEGDVRGGISASVPLEPYLADSRRERLALFGSHGGIWLVGLAAIGFLNRRARERLADWERVEREVREFNETLERRVRQRTAEMEKANKDLESFSYSVSHDLRAPLRALNGYASIIIDDERGRLSPEGQQMLDRIRANAERMGALIDDILEFSRVGRRDMTWVPVDMAALVTTVVAELVADYPAAQVIVGDLPTLPGDAAMLRQLWANLIGNALKFSAKREKPVIEVGVAEADGMPVFHVRDNGAGFDMANAERLFKVFQRLHREEDFPGTGAGLAIVKRIVERHGGRVWAEAAVDQGATFYFTLATVAEAKKPASPQA